MIPGAGEGLFVKQDVDQLKIVAFFAGVEVSGCHDSSSEYSISWLHGSVLDIPESLRDNYRCTLGHKVCHSFKPNCEYSWSFHPRFGRIRSIRSLRNLKKGEEILTDYKYNYSKAPEWYKNDLKQFLISTYDMSASDTDDYISKINCR